MNQKYVINFINKINETYENNIINFSWEIMIIIHLAIIIILGILIIFCFDRLNCDCNCDFFKCFKINYYEEIENLKIRISSNYTDLYNKIDRVSNVYNNKKYDVVEINNNNINNQNYNLLHNELTEVKDKLNKLDCNKLKNDLSNIKNEHNNQKNKIENIENKIKN